jgi:hypothetical protein
MTRSRPAGACEAAAALLLSAIASYGQILGPLEALNGVTLFGLTTAFLFVLIQRIWPLGSRLHGRSD